MTETLTVILAGVIFISGMIAIIAGVALIFWPAALIVGGVVCAAIGAFLIEIPERSKPRGPTAREMGAGERGAMLP